MTLQVHTFFDLICFFLSSADSESDPELELALELEPEPELVSSSDEDGAFLVFFALLFFFINET